MTFSIAAASGDGQEFGIAVASKFLAVGAAVPAAAAGLGALATQAHANVAYRVDGLAALAAGRSAEETVAALTGADEGRSVRQLGVVDARGGSCTYTGADCHDWAGGACGPGYAIQGNILTGPDVVAAMEGAWLAHNDAPLIDRLIHVLAAGDLAGGDRRGRQSAALLVVRPGGGYGGGNDIYADLRVDDHPNPVIELARIARLHRLYFEPPDPATLLELDDDRLAALAIRLITAGYPPADSSTAGVLAALESWAGVENLEERLVADGRIDPLVWRHLERQVSA